MKRIIIAILFISTATACFAQEKAKDTDEEENKGFKKENVFTGGGLDLGLSTYYTELGVNPVLGYSLNKWLDAGVVFNFSYISQKVTDYYGYLTGDKVRQFNYGPGAFVRLYPVNFLFAQAQFEQNFITQKYIYGNGAPTDKYNVSASSLLVGAGYCTGREDDSRNPFFYLSIMFDVLADKNSPYVLQNGNGTVSIIPIIRGGIQIPLFQGGGGSHTGYHRHQDY